MSLNFGVVYIPSQEKMICFPANGTEASDRLQNLVSNQPRQTQWFKQLPSFSLEIAREWFNPNVDPNHHAWPQRLNINVSSKGHGTHTHTCCFKHLLMQVSLVSFWPNTKQNCKNMKCENKFNNSAKPRSGKDSKCHKTTHRRKIVHPCSSHGDHLRHHIWLICDPKIHLSLDQLRHNLDNVQQRQGFLFRGLAWRDLKGDVVSVCSPVLYRARGHQRAILVASSTFSTSFHHHHHSFLPSFPYVFVVFTCGDQCPIFTVHLHTSHSFSLWLHSLLYPVKLEALNA